MSLLRQDNNGLKKIATGASVFLSISLMLIKLFASVYTGSLAVLSSLVDSISDIFASLITFIAVRFSTLPASKKHRYGYGKAEALSALVQSAFVAGSGIFVIYEGIDRIFNPRPLNDTFFGILVKKTSSIAVQADSLHYMVDIITNATIILSLLVVKFLNIWWFDTLTAIFVSGYLLYNAYKIAKSAVSLLLDKELETDVRKSIENIVKNCSFCLGMHDLRTRDLGGIYIFEFHLELDGNLSLYNAHKLTDIIEQEVKNLYPGSQVIIHQDPAGVEEERLDNILVK